MNNANRSCILLEVRMMHDTHFIFPKKYAIVACGNQNILSSDEKSSVRIRRMKVDRIDTLVISDKGILDFSLLINVPDNQL